MEKILMSLRALGSLILILSLSSCASAPHLPDYREGIIDAEIVWCDGTTELSMRVHIEAASDNQTSRDLTVELLTPPALEGIIITRKADEISVACGEMQANAEALSSYLYPTDLLLTTGVITPVTQTELDGVKVQYAQIQKENENESYELFLSPETGYPKEIRHGKESLQIRNFNRTP